MNTVPARVTFDLAGELPRGTTVLEASAGTGKTHAIVGLATRYIADGLPIGNLLLVTFSRMAAAELRERTRERLRTVAAGLADPNAPADDLVELLRTGGSEMVSLRTSRIAAALSDFDAATVSTTHTFCSRMLDALGTAGERERGITLVEEVDDLAAEVAGDIYLQWFSGDTAARFDHSQAVAIAKNAVRQSHAVVVPVDPPEGSEAEQRVRFVAAVRAEVIRRKRLMGIRDYDELQSMLRDVISDPVHGAAARARIRDLFSVVLVDEFQDTDPIQWEILRACFHGHTTLVLVGDPKQSIYKFRGAEVLSYLDAARSADSHQALSTNWRTDAGLVAALDHLHGAAELGHPDIVVRPVDAAHRDARLPGRTPLRLRYLTRGGHGRAGKSGFPGIANLRADVVSDVAADVARLLNSGADYDDPDATTRPVRPADVVILLHRRVTIAPLQRALTELGVASVVGAGSSVFTTASARDWFHVLRAVEQPTRVDRVVLAALTPLLGYSTAQMDDSTGDDAIAEVGQMLTDMAATLGESGFAAMYEQMAARTGLEERILSAADGERTMTDIAHLASLCNRYTVTESRGPAGLLRWFADRLDDPGVGDQSEQSRRLDRDAAAVSIMTVHGSKGLEFPIVYVPFGWDAARNPSLATVDLHDSTGRRVIDVGGQGGPGRAANEKIADDEDAGEALRLFYVAVTRARSEVVLWWAPSTSTSRSPLHRLLFGRGDRGTSTGPDPSPTARVPGDASMAEAMAAWARPAGELISVEHSGGEGIVTPGDEATVTPAPTLTAARLDRQIDHTWRRTSYSAIVADHHGHGVGAHSVGDDLAAPEFVDDEPDAPSVGSSTSDASASGEIDAVPALPSLMNDLPGGAAFGTLVHAILEDVDTDASDLTAEVDAVCTRRMSTSGLQMDRDLLSAAIHEILRTPLGLGPGVDLASVSAADRLCEVDFEFPLRPGSDSADTLAVIADLLDEHIPASDPLAGYATVLRTIPAVTLEGFLTGSIDAVLRIGSVHVVVDYKTNRLGFGALTVDDYTETTMAAEMIRSHYPLQALLYSVALHRYLRWRLPDYRPEDNLGAVRYLFVRAMVGADTPPGRGVFRWHPSDALVVAVSDLLGGRR